MQYTTHTLANNLRTLFIDTDSFPSFTALLLVNVGSRDESQKLGGISHFIEHMTFKGSKKYPTAYDISSTIEGMGAIVNAYTSKDHTGYWVKAPIAHAHKVIDVMADIVLYPRLVLQEMEREKKVIIEEINMYEDMPSHKVSDIYDEVLFKGSRLAAEIAGTAKTVSSFTQSQVQDYMQKHYNPESSLLVISGGINKHIKQLTSQINATFGAWKSGKVNKRTHVQYQQPQPNIRIHTKKTEQAHVCMGFRTFAYKDKRRYALTVLSALLGGGMSSRMFIQIRECLGLCYYISTGHELYEDTGYIVTQAGIKNDAATMKQALTAMYKEYRTITEGGISRQELVRAKELLKGRLILSLEDSRSVASFIAGQIRMTGHYKTPEEVIAHIEAVTSDEVAALAQKLFVPSNITIAAIASIRSEEIDWQDVLS